LDEGKDVESSLASGVAVDLILCDCHGDTRLLRNGLVLKDSLDGISPDGTLVNGHGFERSPLIFDIAIFDDFIVDGKTYDQIVNGSVLERLLKEGPAADDPGVKGAPPADGSSAFGGSSMVRSSAAGWNLCTSSTTSFGGRITIMGTVSPSGCCTMEK
jgi:hypothetical protein